MYNSFIAGIKVYMENSLGLKFYFGHYDQSEIQNGVKVTLPKLMWTLPKNRQWIETSFATKVEFQTALSSLQVSCRRALRKKYNCAKCLQSSKISEVTVSMYSVICADNGFISLTTYTAQKMKFSIKDFFSKCNQIRRKLRIWSHLLKKSLIEFFVQCYLLHADNITIL